MYNEELHNQWASKLKDACRDKNVLIVGNSLKLCGKEYGSLIDGYDFVVRLGKGIPYPEIMKFVGIKTDCWIAGLFRIDAYSFFKDAKFKILTYAPLSKNSKLPNTRVSRRLFDKNFQLYKDYFTIGSLSDTQELVEYPFTTINHPSQGYVAVNFFLKKVQTYKTLTLIGFDFFESKITYSYQGKIFETESFHVPWPAVTKEDTIPDVFPPHHTGKYEKEFFLDLEKQGQIKIIKVDTPPTQETVDLLMRLFRYPGKAIEWS